MVDLCPKTTPDPLGLTHAGATLIGKKLLAGCLSSSSASPSRSAFGSGREMLAQYAREHRIERRNLVANPQFAAAPTAVERQIGLVPADFDGLD